MVILNACEFRSWLVPNFGDFGFRSLVLLFIWVCVCFQLRACLTPFKLTQDLKEIILEDSLMILSKATEGTQNNIEDSLAGVACIWDCCFWIECWLVKVNGNWPWLVLNLGELGFMSLVFLFFFVYKYMDATLNKFDPPPFKEIWVLKENHPRSRIFWKVMEGHKVTCPNMIFGGFQLHLQLWPLDQTMNCLIQQATRNQGLLLLQLS